VSWQHFRVRSGAVESQILCSIFVYDVPPLSISELAGLSYGRYGDAHTSKYILSHSVRSACEAVACQVIEGNIINVMVVKSTRQKNTAVISLRDFDRG
jgi:hypothetical protein